MLFRGKFLFLITLKVIKMKIIISPAKKLNYDKESYLVEPTNIQFPKEAERLIKKLKKLKPQAISELMHLSQSLADLNYERYQNWELPFDEELVKPAAFAFDGEVYTGLDIRSFSKDQLIASQDNLMILSGLYGILRPLDKMMPYRLEMGTSFAYSPTNKNLYQYWSKTLTKTLLDNLSKDEVLVNLASKEYSKVLDLKQVSNPIVTPVFKEQKGDDYKVVMVFAKKARGMMTQYLLKNNIEDLEGVKSFGESGYCFNENLSTETEIVFTR